jgi:hypothetical protein
MARRLPEFADLGEERVDEFLDPLIAFGARGPVMVISTEPTAAASTSCPAAMRSG